MASPSINFEGTAIAVPTAPDDESPVQHGPGEPGGPAVPADGLESFLSVVRGMVHGGDEPVAEQTVDEVAEPVAEVPEPRQHPASTPRDWVADDGQSDWLPGTWVVDAPAAPRRRADRGVEKALARHEKKLLEQERRNVRGSRKKRRGSAAKEPEAVPELEVVTELESDAVAPVSRVPAQSDPATADDTPGAEPATDRPGVEARQDRRQRRRDAARAQAVSNEPGAELVPSGPMPAVGASSRGSKGSRRRDRRREPAGSAGGGEGQSGQTPAVSGAMSETAPMSQLDTEGAPTRSAKRQRRSAADAGPAEVPTVPEPIAPKLSRSERRSERVLAKRARRADARAAEIQRQVAAEAAKAAHDEQKRLAKAEKREARLDQKVSRKAAAAAKRERHTEEVGARKEAEADARALRAAEKGAEIDAATAQHEAEAEERTAREAEQAAARATGQRQRLEGKLARLEARATARADKDAQRLARRTARADAKSMAEAEALERRQDRRVRRIEKRRNRADAKSAAEIEELERRRERRSRRLKKRSARASAKARDESGQLERQRDEIERLAPDLPVPTPGSGVLEGAVPTASPEVVAGEPLAEPDRPSRRERRRDAALARELARVAADGTPTPDATPEDESLADYLGRVEARALPRRSRRSRPRVPLRVRRAARTGAVCVLIAGAAVLPWAAPQVAGLIADAVPGGGSHVATIKDPPVAPRTKSLAGPVGITTETDPLDGKRLAAAGWPRRVVVPRLHVDSTVVPISGQSGSLLPPSDPQVLGWWREGQPVGAQFGSAVITGHTVHTGGGALDNLDKLAVGDTLRVRTDDGWISYVVRRAQIYSTEALARNADAIFRLGGPGRLVMITCDDWNGTFYESNAVVFASPTSDDPFNGEGVGHVPDPGPGGSS